MTRYLVKVLGERYLELRQESGFVRSYRICGWWRATRFPSFVSAHQAAGAFARLIGNAGPPPEVVENVTIRQHIRRWFR